MHKHICGQKTTETNAKKAEIQRGKFYEELDKFYFELLGSSRKDINCYKRILLHKQKFLAISRSTKMTNKIKNRIFAQ